MRDMQSSTLLLVALNVGVGERGEVVGTLQTRQKVRWSPSLDLTELYPWRVCSGNRRRLQFHGGRYSPTGYMRRALRNSITGFCRAYRPTECIIIDSLYYTREFNQSITVCGVLYPTITCGWRSEPSILTIYPTYIQTTVVSSKQLPVQVTCSVHGVSLDYTAVLPHPGTLDVVSLGFSHQTLVSHVYNTAHLRDR